MFTNIKEPVSDFRNKKKDIRSINILLVLQCMLHENKLGLGLWCLPPLSTIFQLYCGRSALLRRSALLVDETRVLRENHRHAAVADRLYHIMINVVSSTHRHERDLNSHQLYSD
jgi:hypothetical protein